MTLNMLKSYQNSWNALNVYRIHIHASSAFKPYQNHIDALSLYPIRSQIYNLFQSNQYSRDVLSVYQIQTHVFWLFSYVLSIIIERETKNYTTKEKIYFHINELNSLQINIETIKNITLNINFNMDG